MRSRTQTGRYTKYPEIWCILYRRTRRNGRSPLGEWPGNRKGALTVCSGHSRLLHCMPIVEAVTSARISALYREKEKPRQEQTVFSWPVLAGKKGEERDCRVHADSRGRFEIKIFVCMHSKLELFACAQEFLIPFAEGDCLTSIARFRRASPEVSESSFHAPLTTS